MTVEERVVGFLRSHAGTGFCDDCLASELELKNRRQARNPTSAVGNSRDFSRAKHACSRCGKSKLVTRALETQR
jgi:hypothetical protein